MKSENLTTLKINKLSQDQYDRELQAEKLNENELYLTPAKTEIWKFIVEKEDGTTEEVLKVVYVG